MRLFYFIEQNYRVRFAAYGLRELSALVVSYVSRRRTDQPAYAEFLLIFRHVDTRHQRLVVEEVFGQSLGQFGLAYTGRSQEDERTDGTFRVLQSRTAAPHGIAHGLYGFVLPDDPFVEFLFQMEQLLALALQHLAHGYARPTAYHIGDVFRGHFLFNHRVCALRVLQLVLYPVDFVLQCLELAVADFGHLAIVAFAFGPFGLELQLLDLLFVLLDFVHQSAFGLPFGLVAAFLFFLFGNLLAQLFQFGLVVFPFDGLALDFQLFQPAFDFVQFLRYGVTLHTQFGCRLVHQVDGLVREETVGDIAVGKFHGGDDGVVLDTHLVVVLISFLQSPQDGNGAERVRLVDHDRLETAFQCLVLFEVLLVFVQRGGTDASQLAPCQGRLQDVGGIHGTLAFSRAHQRVDFVDEKDDAPFAFRHFVDDGFQTFLKLSFVFGTGDKRAHVEGVELFVFQVLRYVAPQDTMSQSFHDGRLTRTRFAD